MWYDSNANSYVDRADFAVQFPALLGFQHFTKMANKRKAVAYYRERESNKDTLYATKFAGFVRAVAKAKESGCDMIIIAEPWVIGDTYEEITESLSHLAGSDVGLCIVSARKAPWNN